LRYPALKIFGTISRAHYKATTPALSNLHENCHAPPFRHFFFSTYDAPELAARAYDTAALHFRHPRRDLNFSEVESLEVAELLVPPPRLLDNEDRHRHHKVQRRLAIAERNEQLMDE
jgi:hypothetical protein